MKSLKSNKGFTLIELVVVIAILGILAGIAIPRFMDATKTARGAKIVADLRTIDSAIMIYTAKNGSEPAEVGDLYTANASSNLLASWPTPPQGQTAIITNAKGKPVEWTTGATAAYKLGKENSTTRAMIDTFTIDAILGADSASGAL